MRVVIVGNGIAGANVAFGLRQKNSKTEILVLSAENYPVYDPCTLPYFVGEEISKDVVFVKQLSDYQKQNIEVVFDEKVLSIDSKQKTVNTSIHQYPYDELVLAYGGDLFVPPIDGINLLGVFGGKSLTHTEELDKHSGRRAVVIGSGAIGVEFAVALKLKKYEVTLIELCDWILPTMFDKKPADILKQLLESNGIRVLTKEKVLTIEGKTKVSAVITDQRKITCDTIIMATGVVVDKALAQSADVAVDHAILVNTQMQTNVSDIYACGDCAETLDICADQMCVYQLKHNAIAQAKIVVQNILGEKDVYPGSYQYARIHFFDTHAASFGTTLNLIDNRDDIEVIDRGAEDDFLRVILKRGKIIGAQAIGKSAYGLWILMNAMWKQDDIHEIRKNWEEINNIDSPFPWEYRKLGELLKL